MKIKPLFDRVIIREIKADTTSSGIFIGKSNSDGPKTGEVLFVGDGNYSGSDKKQDMQVKVGDKVLYSKFAGEDTIINKELVTIIRQTEILAIIG